MEKHQFTKTQVLETVALPKPVYLEGKAYWLRPDQVRRWQRRGVIVPAPADMRAENEEDAPKADIVEPNADPVVEPVELVEIPDDWASLHHATRKKIAKLISGVDAENTEAADEVISAELKRRAAGDAGDDEGDDA